MQTDLYGNPVTTTRTDTLQGTNDFIRGFLTYDPCMVNVLAAAEADAEDCLINAYAGMLWMFLESPEAPEKAKGFIDRALAAADQATPREANAAQIAALWAKGDVPALLDLCEAVIDAHPRDLAIVKLVQYHMFNRGDAPGMLRVGLKALPAADEVPQVHGMIAFGYEQCHLIPDAEAAARRALELEPNEPWAHHALAHVMLTEGRVQEGIDFLESVSASWDGLNSFMYTHNWWHLALFYLSRGRFADALEIYDKHVWGVAKDYSQDQVGAASLLARIELAGAEVGGRWQDVADHVAERGADTTQPFLTMQYVYALGRAGRDAADALVDAVAARAADADAPDHKVWAEVAFPACRGLLAHARGDMGTTAEQLGRVLPRMAEAGGSHAQRDLFGQIYLDALVRSGRLDKAQQILELRRGFDPDGVPLNRMLAKVYADVGLPEQAAQATQRAEVALAGNPA